MSMSFLQIVPNIPESSFLPEILISQLPSFSSDIPNNTLKLSRQNGYYNKYTSYSNDKVITDKEYQDLEKK